jgi:endonuclease G
MATLEEHQIAAAERYYRKKGEKIAEGKAEAIPARLRFINEYDGFAKERLIGKSDLVGVNFFELGLQAARAVCRIQIRDSRGFGKGYGTGFLVAPNLLLTNNHVLNAPELAIKSLAEFNFEDGIDFMPKPTKLFTLLPGELFYTNEKLNFTFVAVSPAATDGSPLSSFGALKLIEETGKAQPAEYVSII